MKTEMYHFLKRSVWKNMGNIIELTNTYRMIKAEYKYDKKALWRKFLVREDIDLVDLGCVLCTLLKTEFEHCFLFAKGEIRYVPAVFLENYSSMRDRLMDSFTLRDLGDSFSFEYDTGESWDFSCKVYKKEEYLPDSRIAILLDGKGAGIWEDNSHTFREYRAGMIDPIATEEDLEEPFSMPWNLELERIGDFDEPLDIAAEQGWFDELIDDNIAAYREHMCLDSYEDDSEEDEDEKTVSELITDFLNMQIESVPHVKKTFERLSKKYGDEIAFEMIGNVFMEQFMNLGLQAGPYSMELYKKNLSELN